MIIVKYFDTGIENVIEDLNDEQIMSEMVKINGFPPQYTRVLEDSDASFKRLESVGL
jgi:hypothetical protein